MFDEILIKLEILERLGELTAEQLEMVKNGNFVEVWQQLHADGKEVTLWERLRQKPKTNTTAKHTTGSISLSRKVTGK